MKENKDLNLANITPLIGRRFVAKSNNICRIEALAKAHIRATWTWKPSEEDKNEFIDWTQTILGPLDAEVKTYGKRSDPINQERAKFDYLNWLDDLKNGKK